MSTEISRTQKGIPGIQMMAQKICRRACELFCLPYDSLMYKKVTYHPEKETKTTALLNPPSTILIVNISNSTLINCHIGNGTYESAAERQPIIQESERPDRRCSCFCEQPGFEPSATPAPQEECPNISIHSSHLNCVIIGNDNSMHVEEMEQCD